MVSQSRSKAKKNINWSFVNIDECKYIDNYDINDYYQNVNYSEDNNNRVSLFAICFEPENHMYNFTRLPDVNEHKYLTEICFIPLHFILKKKPLPKKGKKSPPRRRRKKSPQRKNSPHRRRGKKSPQRKNKRK